MGMLKLANIQAVVAPLATPAAPASVLAIEVYRVLVELGVFPLVALVIAVVGVFAGVEASGALAFYTSIEAWRQRRWGMMFVAVLAAVVYVAIIGGAVYLIPGTSTLVVALLALALPVGYVGTALWMALRQSAEQAVAAADHELELLHQRRLLVNAEARRAKAGVQRGVQSSNGQLDTQVELELTDLGKAILAILDDDSGLSNREIARRLECSPSSVTTWRAVWLDRQASDG